MTILDHVLIPSSVATSIKEPVCGLISGFSLHSSIFFATWETGVHLEVSALGRDFLLLGVSKHVGRIPVYTFQYIFRDHPFGLTTSLTTRPSCRGNTNCCGILWHLSLRMTKREN
eukprot:TRINITY_DN5104_c0_g1_i14.p1 TRINITY_DN5104_c0_g1~~TRINITY_DN5104_c0_g1_i14.p1  ORF type:complete len:115 (-),score=11.20 TRINITY_DN5104_c0_g1_i14:149-493(-)